MATVKIHYRRLPDRITVYENELVYADETVIVTVMRATPLARPVTVAGKPVLEDGAPAVWFTFPGADYDVGRFHTADRRYTGLYANVITPVEFASPTEWRTTDLFVDVWADAAGPAVILDEDELLTARHQRWIEPAMAERARATAHRLLREYNEGTWPPPVVYDWPLERIPGKTS